MELLALPLCAKDFQLRNLLKFGDVKDYLVLLNLLFNYMSVTQKLPQASATDFYNRELLLI